jgi:hypothetical protein
MKKLGIVLIIFYFISAVYQMLRWLKCNNLYDSFHFSPLGYILRIEEYTHNDKETLILFVRMMHNKISVFIPEVFHSYVRLWDLNFLIALLTLLGLVGVGLGFWYTYTQKKKKWLLVLTGVVLLVPFIEILFPQYLPFVVRVLMLWIPLQLLAVFGLYSFLSQKKLKGVVIIGSILLISILWMSILGEQLFSYCTKV